MGERVGLNNAINQKDFIANKRVGNRLEYDQQN